MTWKGSVINGSRLIYQDEIEDNPLICNSNQGTVGWHFATGRLLSLTSTTDHFRQERTVLSKSKLIINRPNNPLTSTAGNGLWTCRLNGGVHTAFPVGIYARGEGENTVIRQQNTQVSDPSVSLLCRKQTTDKLYC